MSAITEFKSAMNVGQKQGVTHNWFVSVDVEYDLSENYLDTARKNLDALFHSVTPATNGEPTRIIDHEVSNVEFDDRANLVTASATVEFDIPMPNADMARVFALTLLGDIIRTERDTEGFPPITDYEFISFDLQ